MSEHWAVTVSRRGEAIVTIESNCLCGRDISPEDDGTIRTAALHLLGFIGESPENAALAARDARVAELEGAVREIERKYVAIMRDPPEWVSMTPEQLKWVREAWYGASLIVRAVLQSVAEPGRAEPAPATEGE